MIYQIGAPQSGIAEIHMKRRRAKYFTEGQEEVSLLDDQKSHNTQRLTIPEIKDKLMKIEFVKQELGGSKGFVY